MKPSYFLPGSRQVSASALNRLVEPLRTGSNVHAGAGMTKTTLHGKVMINQRKKSPGFRRPFEAWAEDLETRKVRVAAGVCYVYGVAFNVVETDVVLDASSTRVWVQFPITPGTEDEPTIEFGTAADLADVDRNTHAFRVLAHVEMGDSDAILRCEPRWFAGDVYFDD